MKKILSIILFSAMLTLTACGKTENSSESVPQSISEYVHPIAKTPPESGEDSTENFAETSDTSSEIAPEIAYKIGDLIGLDSLPSRGIAAYTVTINYVYPQDESRNRTVTEFYDEHGNMLFDGKYRYYSYEYDGDGRILKEYEKADEYDENEYDDNGLLVKTTTSRGGRVTMIIGISYDEHGEMSEWVADYYNDDGTSVPLVYLRYERQYDENGRQIMSTSYNKADEVREITVREYYDDGTLKSSRCTTPNDDGGIREIHEWMYDTSGRMTGRRAVRCGENGAVSSSTRDELTYDADGRLAECLSYDTETDELIWRETYEYIFANTADPTRV